MNVGAVLKAAFRETLLEPSGGDVVPAAFPQKFVPDLDFLFRRTTAVSEAPFQYLFIGASSENLRAEIGIGHMEKVDTTKIKALAQIGDVILREKVLGMQSDFVQHAPEVNEGLGLSVWAPDGGDLHFDEGYSPLEVIGSRLGLQAVVLWEIGLLSGLELLKRCRRIQTCMWNV